MTSKEMELVKQLESRVRQLILQGQNLREQYRALEVQVAQRDEQIKALEGQKAEVAAQYANLKVARMLELSDSDTRNARQRVSRLVREVDKCIALLKA